jgi:hypothetical protein
LSSGGLVRYLARRGLPVVYSGMPIAPVEFKVGDRVFRYQPWGAISAVSEWGNLIGELGEGVLERLLLPGSVALVISALTEQPKDGDENKATSTAATEVALRSVIRVIGDTDLADRADHYLASGRVEVQHAGAWVPLYGPRDEVETALDAAGVDGLEYLSAAWHVVREGLRPLFARLRSIATAQATK